VLWIEELDWGTWHYSRNRVLINQLRLGIAPKQQAEIVKPGDNTLKFNAIHQEDCDWYLLLANVVEEGILKVLRFFGGHFWPLVVRQSAQGDQNCRLTRTRRRRLGSQIHELR
jgi:hypothetical protein